ncbi:endonuclease/exonuclease/phosphatase family protein [Flavobacterium sp. 140616W15]|uniref:endonuclease/exonuclease/phosphatase family protein n=1 Tax=Flavobacterium sp. 140616W15 TaxID=2478552 RepID=UPI00268CBB9F
MKRINKLVALLLFLSFCGTYGQNLKIMTYNIRLDVASDGENAWPNRKDFFTSQIQFYAPDVFGVQEAMPNQVNDIATALPSYNHVGIAREGDGKGESSSIFYKKDRFLVQQSNTFWLSQTPDVISKGWDAAYNRVCTYALFKDLKTKKYFGFLILILTILGKRQEPKV